MQPRGVDIIKDANVSCCKENAKEIFWGPPGGWGHKLAMNDPSQSECKNNMKAGGATPAGFKQEALSPARGSCSIHKVGVLVQLSGF